MCSFGFINSLFLPFSHPNVKDRSNQIKELVLTSWSMYFNLSFLIQVADNSTLYGCCVLVEEMVQKPSGLLSMISDGQHTSLGISRQILTTRRCYCILSRLPFFDLHFGVLHRFVSLLANLLYCPDLFVVVKT